MKVDHQSRFLAQTGTHAKLPTRGVAPSTLLLNDFWASEGPGEERGGAPDTVPLQNPQVTSQKTGLRNADCIPTTFLRKRGAGNVCALVGDLQARL